MRISTIGSALVDIFIQFDEFVFNNLGEVKIKSETGKLDVDGFEVKTGGGASNTAVGFARFGFKAQIISELGQDNLAKLILAELKQEKVKTSLIIKEKKEVTGGSVILVAKDGRRLILSHRGAASMLDPKDIVFDKFKNSDWVHLTSLSGQEKTLKHIFNNINKNLSWNPGSADLKSIAQNKLDNINCQILFVNKQEWQIIKNQHKKLINNIKIIIITDSTRGGQILANHQTINYQAKKTKSIDNTGAGDAFCVGFISRYLLDENLVEAANWGAKNAASVVKQIGAKPGLLHKSDLG